MSELSPLRRPNALIHPHLDRAAERRRDGDWLAARLADPDSRLWPVWRGTRTLIDGPAEAPAAVSMAPVGSPSGGAWRKRASEIVFLGLLDGRAQFAVAFGDEPGDGRALADAFTAEIVPGRFADLREMGSLLPADEAAMAAYARAIIWWHRRHRFCGICGTPTAPEEGGHLRRCTNPDCAQPTFPRTDPAVIVLVHDGDRILLGRQRGWPAAMHSVLAGFVEPGESLESCVVREVFEESGVRVDDIRYHSSQPWPFPQSLMVGFFARATNRDLAMDEGELEALGWFDRATVAAAPAEMRTDIPFSLPRRLSVARRLIDDWLAGNVPLD